MKIPAELDKQAAAIIKRYPASKRSASLPLLHLVQGNFGYVPDEAIEWVAGKLDLQPINILELVTFYPGFHQKPRGKNHIRVCRTLSCAMAGSYELMESICKAANIDRSNVSHHDPVAVSKDGEFSIEFAECLASCGTGPVCMVNDDFYEEVEPGSVKELLDKYRPAKG